MKKLSLKYFILLFCVALFTSKVYSQAAGDPYHGATDDGYSMSGVNNITCTKDTVDATAYHGTTDDGYSMSGVNNITCAADTVDATVYHGTTDDGYSMSAFNNITCIKDTVDATVYHGVTDDGYSMSAFNNITCVKDTVDETVYHGTTDDGYALFTGTCIPIIGCFVTASVESDTAICIGTSVTRVASGGVSYLWSTGDTTSSITVTPFIDTSYQVIVIDGACLDSITVNIMINALPVVTTSDTSIVSGESVDITADATGNSTYDWSPPTDLSCTTCQTPTATPTVTTIYSVTATDSNFCINTGSVLITLTDPPPLEVTEVFVPNGFSPNNDGENDVSRVLGSNVVELQFIIYDRWGEKVFETTNQQDGWDGTFRGQPMNPAVFVYYLTATLSDGTLIKQTGNISLVR